MKILSVEVWNFGSYPHLKFEFQGVGLALIHGPTGAGKSTLMDITPWCLYGVTAKGGTVEEIRSWQAMEEPTKGAAIVQCGGVALTIHHIRGSSGKNDLYWTSGESEEPQRGSNLADTQRRLETLLACSADTYLSSAYFHEFSPTSTFFKDKPKAQRSLLEAVAPLGFAIRLAERASEARKVVKAALTTKERDLDVLRAKLSALEGCKRDALVRFEEWALKRDTKLTGIKANLNNFEQNKQLTVAAAQKKVDDWNVKNTNKINSLTDQLLADEAELSPESYYDDAIAKLEDTTKCPTCAALTPRASAEIAKLVEEKHNNSYAVNSFEANRQELKRVLDEVNPYLDNLAAAKSKVNQWAEVLSHVLEEANPYEEELTKFDADIASATKTTQVANKEEGQLAAEVHALTTVYNLSFDLRGRLLTQAVQEIQDSTNRYLSDYFDAEIKVGFSIEGSDSLQVTLQKSGYDCTYTQLSKGQRGLLKLAFGVSVMKASANAAGAHFDTLAFDEALDGLDTNMKVKAFRLFEELATQHENVLVIDHATELQSLFETKFEVTMIGDKSEMARDT